MIFYKKKNYNYQKEIFSMINNDISCKSENQWKINKEKGKN